MPNPTGNKTSLPKGRPPGAINKSSRTVKETFEQVFRYLQEGKVAKLESWAEQNPTEFYKLSAKLIPAAIEQKVEATMEHRHTVAPTDHEALARYYAEQKRLTAGEN